MACALLLSESQPTHGEFKFHSVPPGPSQPLTELGLPTSRSAREGELTGLLILNCEAIHSIGKLLNELLLCARPYAGVTKMNGPARDCPRGETDTHTTETQADQAQGAG